MGCANIAWATAKQATQVDPSLARAHLLAAGGASLAGVPDDIVLAHVDAALAAGAPSAEAHAPRAYVLLRMYLDRWRAVDGSLLLDSSASDVAELGWLWREARTSLNLGIASTSCDAPLLGRLRSVLERTGADGRGNTIHEWLELGTRWRLQLPPGAAGRCAWVGSFPTNMADWGFEDRLLEHVQIAAWESSWWFSRWPAYGPEPGWAQSVCVSRRDSTRSACAGSPWWRFGGEEALLRQTATTSDRGLALAREAQALEARGDLVAALRRAGEAVSLLQGTPGVRLLRARIHEDLLDMDGAKADYDAAVRLGEGRPEYLRVRAGFLLQTGATEAALEDAQGAMALDRSEVSRVLLGDALVANGRAEEALELLRRTAPREQAARIRALRALGRIDEAVNEARRVGDPIEAAYAALARGDLATAAMKLYIPVSEQDVEYAWTDTPAITDVYPHLDRTCLLEARGRVLLALGREAKALQALDEVVVLQPMRAEAHALRAQALLGLSLVAQASAASQRGVTINPSRPLVWKVHGRVMEAQGRLDEAEEAYKKAVSLDQQDPEAKALLTGLQARIKR